MRNRQFSSALTGPDGKGIGLKNLNLQSYLQNAPRKSGGNKGFVPPSKFTNVRTLTDEEVAAATGVPLPPEDPRKPPAPKKDDDKKK